SLSMGRLHSRIACATPGSTCGRTPGDEELAEFSHPGRTRTSGVRHQPEQAQAGGESLRLAERQCGTVANEISRTAAGAMDVSIGDRCLQFAPSCVLSASSVVGGHSVFARSKSEPAETKKHHYARYFAQRNTRHRESRKNHGIFPQPVYACRKAVSSILVSAFQRLQPRLKPLEINRDHLSPPVGTDKSVPFPQTRSIAGFRGFLPEISAIYNQAEKSEVL